MFLSNNNHTRDLSIDLSCFKYIDLERKKNIIVPIL